MIQKHSIRAFFYFLLIATSIPAVAQSKDYNTIIFRQEDSATTITRSTDSVVLGRKPFSITYYGKRYDSKTEKYYALQVAVLKDAADTLKRAIGKNIEEIQYLASGSGMATGGNGLYDAMMISNEGHHYLYYENEAERRVSRVSIVKDLLELEWRISGAFVDDQDISLPELTFSPLYFVFFADRNLNDTIDQNELKIVKVVFR
jgi:hypothetical protein